MHVCYKCGYINNPDNVFCDNCENNIEDDYFALDIDKSEKHTFFDYKNKTYLDASPFEIEEEKKEGFIEEKTENNEDLVKICPNCGKENGSQSVECECGVKIRFVPLTPKTKKENNIEIHVNNDDEDLVKICPKCGYENDYFERECVCGFILSGIAKTPRMKKVQEKKEEPKPETIELVEMEAEQNEEEYYLLFGINGDNITPVVFVDSYFSIGRNYQSFLEQRTKVSRKHCYLKKMNDGTIYLSESKSHPSTNHTYIPLPGGRLVKVEPGKGYPLKDGSRFYITQEIPVMLKKK